MGVTRRVLWVLLGGVGAAALVLGIQAGWVVRAVPRLFRRNAELKAQGYYMGEFEFRMLAVQDRLDRGRYLEAGAMLRHIQGELADPRRLPRLSPQASAAQQMDFLLARQDPVTGAFMDHSYPYFTYFAPTCNVVEALTELGRITGRPVRLQHPLRFLDSIAAPEALRAYLAPLLYLGPMAARLPGPGPYGPGVSELAAFQDLEAAGLYRFTPAWRTALRQWFYATQDPATGFWGARIGRPGRWRQRTDINSTFHILKLVLDPWGRDQDPRFPLRHADLLARGVLAALDRPMPGDAAEQHDWGLCQAQGARILTRYLWLHLTAADRDRVRRVYRTQLASLYRLYRPADGGFAYYLSQDRADLDGTSLALGTLRDMGVLPGTPERVRLWGEMPPATPRTVLLDLPNGHPATFPAPAGLASFRVYLDHRPSMEGWDDRGVVQIGYPAGIACDLLDLRAGLARFLASGTAGFGNWTSAAGLRRALPSPGSTPGRIPVAWGWPDPARLAREHPGARHIHVVGYDAAQVPIVWVNYFRPGPGQPQAR